MKAYKGTNENMICRGFQYELGKEYTHEGEIELCKSGFHACLKPVDCLSYYSYNGENRFFEVEIDGVSNEKKEDSKVVAKSIKFVREITDLNELLDGAEYIPHEAFINCKSLTSITIPDSVTEIGTWAFQSCSSLTSITIPHSVTSIGDLAFFGCSDITSIIVEENNPVYDSRNSCNAIIETATNILIQGCQNTVIPDSVTSIGDYAFYGCSSLTSITIPDSITSIGRDAFAGCTGLTSITIPDSVSSIGYFAFYGCSSLTSITIPDSVTNISNSAFYGCDSLTSIVIPNSVTSISNWIFNSCEGLIDITIPNSVTKIGSGAFCCCINLISITYNGTKSQWDMIIKEIDWKCNVPSTCMVHCTDGEINI